MANSVAGSIEATFQYLSGGSASSFSLNNCLPGVALGLFHC